MGLQQYFRFLVLTALISTTFATLAYVCNPDDTVDVSGLPSSYNYYAMQGSTQCNVTDNNSTSVKISDCSKDSEILLTYSTYDGMETNSLHGGKTVNAVKISCTEIPTSGNVHVINNTFAANLTIDEETSVNPTYEVTSDLSTYSTTVGSSVVWTIYFPVEYILEVSDCTAYAGTDPSSSDSVSLISSGGCHVNDELIGNFTDNGNGTASATILAFKFYNNDDVFLMCNLKICPSGSTACDESCLGKREVDTRYARDADDSEFPRDFYTKEIHRVLHVIDPNASGAENVSHLNVSVTLTFLLLLVTLIG